MPTTTVPVSHRPYVPQFKDFNHHTELRILGPCRNSDTAGYWAGEHTPRELVELGTELIQHGVRQAHAQGVSLPGAGKGWAKTAVGAAVSVAVAVALDSR